MKVIATVSVCVQIGIDTWQQNYHSKLFEETATISYIIEWGRSFIKNISVNDITLSEYHGD